MRGLHKAIVAALTSGLLIGTAGGASAGDNTRSALSWAPSDEVVATCADGTEIGLGFDIVRNRHFTYGDNGEVLRELRNINYVGIFENLSTADRYTFRGTRTVTWDFVAGTFTSTGNYRTVTQPGQGAVFHTTGREVWDLVTDTLIDKTGPAYDEWSEGAQAVTCGLFGLAG